jgi:3-oxoacyl-[acyl-carrier-protein] synthase III
MSMVQSAIVAVEYFLPKEVLTNSQLAASFPEWSADSILQKTGIAVRHIAGTGELSSDLAYQAASKLFAARSVDPTSIDFVLLCTQTPDFSLPTSACLLQNRLGIPQTAGALDFNLGCSGYIYGLGIAKGLIESHQAKRILLLTAETYSKLIDPKDKNVRTIFGDGAAATIVDSVENKAGSIGPIIYGTDGSGGKYLVCHRGGFRGEEAEARGRNALWMDGPEIFNFTIRVIPDCIGRLLREAQLKEGDVDLYIFHQANLFMLTHIRKKLNISKEKFFVALENFGNTVSSTIPIALCEAENLGRIKQGSKIVLMGFGVGYSWGAALIEWAGAM